MRQFSNNNRAHANPYLLSDAIKGSHELIYLQKVSLLEKLTQTTSRHVDSIWENWYKRTHAVTN